MLLSPSSSCDHSTTSRLPTALIRQMFGSKLNIDQSSSKPEAQLPLQNVAFFEDRDNGASTIGLASTLGDRVTVDAAASTHPTPASTAGGAAQQTEYKQEHRVLFTYGGTSVMTVIHSVKRKNGATIYRSLAGTLGPRRSKRMGLICLHCKAGRSRSVGFKSWPYVVIFAPVVSSYECNGSLALIAFLS